DDLDQLMWVACLAATGMSVGDMRRYVANGVLGPSAAAEQIELLSKQGRRLALEAENLALRKRYVRLKIAYWRAVAPHGSRALEKCPCSLLRSNLIKARFKTDLMPSCGD